MVNDMYYNTEYNSFVFSVIHIHVHTQKESNPGRLLASQFGFFSQTFTSSAGLRNGSPRLLEHLFFNLARTALVDPLRDTTGSSS